MGGDENGTPPQNSSRDSTNMATLKIDEYRHWVHSEVSKDVFRRFARLFSFLGSGIILALGGASIAYIGTQLTTVVDNQVPNVVARYMVDRSLDQRLVQTQITDQVSRAANDLIPRLVAQHVGRPAFVDDLSQRINATIQQNDFLLSSILDSYAAIIRDASRPSQTRAQFLTFLSAVDTSRRRFRAETIALFSSNANEDPVRVAALDLYYPTADDPSDLPVIDAVLSHLQSRSARRPTGERSFAAAATEFLSRFHGAQHVSRLTAYARAAAGHASAELVASALGRMSTDLAVTQLAEFAAASDLGIARLGWLGLSQLADPTRLSAETRRQIFERLFRQLVGTGEIGAVYGQLDDVVLDVCLRLYVAASLQDAGETRKSDELLRAIDADIFRAGGQHPHFTSLRRSLALVRDRRRTLQIDDARPSLRAPRPPIQLETFDAARTVRSSIALDGLIAEVSPTLSRPENAIKRRALAALLVVGRENDDVTHIFGLTQDVPTMQPQPTDAEDLQYALYRALLDSMTRLPDPTFDRQRRVTLANRVALQILRNPRVGHSVPLQRALAEVVTGAVPPHLAPLVAGYVSRLSESRTAGSRHSLLTLLAYKAWSNHDGNQIFRAMVEGTRDLGNPALSRSLAQGFALSPAVRSTDIGRPVLSVLSAFSQRVRTDSRLAGPLADLVEPQRSELTDIYAGYLELLAHFIASRPSELTPAAEESDAYFSLALLHRMAPPPRLQASLASIRDGLHRLSSWMDNVDRIAAVAWTADEDQRVDARIVGTDQATRWIRLRGASDADYFLMLDRRTLNDMALREIGILIFNPETLEMRTARWAPNNGTRPTWRFPLRIEANDQDMVLRLSLPADTPEIPVFLSRVRVPSLAGAARREDVRTSVAVNRTYQAIVAGVHGTWARFEARQGYCYLLETSRLAADLDTVVEVVADDGTVLARDDDSGSDPFASRLQYFTEESGSLFIRVSQWGEDARPGRRFRLAIQERQTSQESCQ
jgi:hypothetical protein